MAWQAIIKDRETKTVNPLLVISGASRGIGLATAKRFASEGYQVVNLSRQQPDLAEYAPALHHFASDLSDNQWPAALPAQFYTLLESTDTITLIHNAALLARDSIEDLAAEDFARVLQLNVIANTQLNQLVLAAMKPGSSILYVSSTLGEKAVGNTCSYVTSKHAQIGLMRATCQDLMGRGIHTAAICPGFTDTEMLRTHVGADQATLDHFASMNSFNRLASPDEIAQTLWFCSQNPVVNGAVMHANLGQRES